MNYRELQATIRQYKEQGLTTIKLNVSAAELEEELQRLTVANTADRFNQLCDESAAFAEEFLEQNGELVEEYFEAASMQNSEVSEVAIAPDSEQFPYLVEALKSCLDEPSSVHYESSSEHCESSSVHYELSSEQTHSGPYNIPFWLTGKPAAQAKALIDFGFWYIGDIDEWGILADKEIIAVSGDWTFNYCFAGLFVEARCQEAVFNIGTHDTTCEEDEELVSKAIQAIDTAAKEWGEQFGQQLTLFDFSQVRSPPVSECA